MIIKVIRKTILGSKPSVTLIWDVGQACHEHYIILEHIQGLYCLLTEEASLEGKVLNVMVIFIFIS